MRLVHPLSSSPVGLTDRGMSFAAMKRTSKCGSGIGPGLRQGVSANRSAGVRIRRQVGTPRVVADSTGTVIKIVEYDSFGNRTNDTNPDFNLPIGFAGGLEDVATGLVRFGYRDYDQRSGRWTSRDPALYDGGQVNLYVYVANDPVGARDPFGLWCTGASAYGGFGGGAELCCRNGVCSLCTEAGIGVGSDIGISSGGPRRNSTETGLDFMGKVGGDCFGAGGNANCTLNARCGLNCEAGAKLGPFEASTSGGFQVDPTWMPKLRCDWGGKLAARSCRRFVTRKGWRSALEEALGWR